MLQLFFAAAHNVAHRWNPQFVRGHHFPGLRKRIGETERQSP